MQQPTPQIGIGSLARKPRELKGVPTIGRSRITAAASKLLLAGIVFLGVGMVSAGGQETNRPTSTLQADGLACPFCVYGIEKQLRQIEGVEDIGVDIETGTVTLTLAEGMTLEETTAREGLHRSRWVPRELLKERMG